MGKITFIIIKQSCLMIRCIQQTIMYTKTRLFHDSLTSDISSFIKSNCYLLLLITYINTDNRDKMYLRMLALVNISSRPLTFIISNTAGRQYSTKFSTLWCLHSSPVAHVLQSSLRFYCVLSRPRAVLFLFSHCLIPVC